MMSSYSRPIDLKTIIVGCLIALAIWEFVAWAWRAFGWLGLLLSVGLGVVAQSVFVLKYWFDGRRGLNQWPEPHGRYYREWLDLPTGSGDYYEWLARKMGNGEPWKTWAALDRDAPS